MTSAQVVETSVNVISNSPSQDYTHPDNRTLLYDMTPGFKPFTIILLIIRLIINLTVSANAIVSDMFHDIVTIIIVDFKCMILAVVKAT